MRLTVLGCSTPLPERDRPCSGYLLSGENTTILFDCGSGVFPILMDYVDPRNLSAVWISHMHPDHSADLITLTNWAVNLTDGAPKIRVFGPPGWDTRLNAFMSEDSSQNMVREIFNVNYLDDGLTTSVGEFSLTSRLVHHSVTKYGVRVLSADGVTFAYSGDTGPCRSLDQLADHADVFLCEAGSETPTQHHLTVQQAQQLGRKARVGKLLLTHMPYDAPSVDDLRADDGPPTTVVDVRDEWAITAGAV